MSASKGFVPGPRLERAGAAGGPLAGLRFAAKDLFDVEGQVTTAGNPDWARTHGRAERTAVVVARLLAAGATLAGKTICDELAFSLSGENGHYGRPLNAAAPERATGGSSCGSAAVVGAEEVDFALGTDTAGSVRVPASYCGLWGIRTSHGRLSNEGLLPLAPSYDTVGWLAGDAALLARVGEALFDDDEPTRGAPERLLVASDALARVDGSPGARASLEQACAQVAAALDLDVEPVELGGLDEGFEAFRVAQGFEVWQTLGPWYEGTRPAIASADIEQRLRWTGTVSAGEAAGARQAGALLAARARELVGPRGLICLPTAPGPAPRLDLPAEVLAAYRGRLLELTAVAGLAGLPQVNLPLASIEGAPLGLSLIAPAGCDRWLLELAARVGAAARA